MLSGAISPRRRVQSTLVLVLGITSFLLPAALLAIGGLLAEGATSSGLYVGALVVLLLAGLLAIPTLGGRRPIGPAVIILYLLTLAWMWLGNGLHDDSFSHLCQSLLLGVPLVLLAVQTLTDSGAFASRRAHLLTQRIALRQEWPEQLAECKTLAEVKALREALAIDASPALGLLQHMRPQVRLAALAALEFRTDWRPGQAEMVVRFARQASEPILRAAALTALANVQERTLIEAIAEFLRDPDPLVRRAAIEALLWDTDHRWLWVRAAFRIAMSDSATLNDGPLVKAGAALLKPEVIVDLSAWAAEKGVLGVRAAASLGAHYDSLLSATPDCPLVEKLRRQLLDPHSPPALRMELAQVLRKHEKLDRELQEQLLDPSNPAPLRLLTADVLLTAGDAFQPAVVALREIARMPNREMALATAEIVQRRLGIDLGLPLDCELPPLQSRLAAEVTRRLMRWASQQTGPTGGDDTGQEGRETKMDSSGRRPGTGSGYHPIGFTN